MNNSEHHLVDNNMCFDPSRETVNMRGYRGGKLNDIKQRGMLEVSKLRPDVVLLQIGSNDLCDPELTVRDIAKGVIEIVLSLLYSHDVKKVVVLQILHRIPPSRKTRYAVDTNWFNSRCDEVNHYLNNYFADNKVEGARFWRHSGFWSPASKQQVYTWDGDHLNDKTGYPKYYRRIRAAMVTVLKN